MKIYDVFKVVTNILLEIARHAKIGLIYIAIQEKRLNIYLIFFKMFFEMRFNEVTYDHIR